MQKPGLLSEASLPFEVVILITAGLIALLAGILLFPIQQGLLPYYENGLYGLFLVLFALQIIVLGKTPFGDAQRSKPLLAIGLLIAALGIVSCCIPGILGQAPRILLFVCFGLGGFSLLVQLFVSKEKYRAWKPWGGVFHHLILGCATVYALSIVVGLVVLLPDALAPPMTAVIVILYGLSIIYLSCALGKVYRVYPKAQAPGEEEGKLSADKAMILLLCLFMVLLGLLLIPVSLGLLPFAPSAQLGLLLLLFALQIMALGNTPIGSFPRTRLLFILGLVFASLGTVSCIIPDFLLFELTLLVGVLNICGGAATIGKVCIPLFKKSDKPRQPVPPILLRLSGAQLTLGLLSILFGASMLISNMIPALIVGIVLASNGLVLLYLLRILVRIDRIKAEARE